ncbi:uncharacterized protein G2W53_014574 [Senna tora]|uniref:Uncharacterized protein n=1 Tax=Senna tora TaxID=362788 RepID=A0A835C2U6_9FABA|nr:uncharacterized protein G2W53_014574 [Senna tora]
MRSGVSLEHLIHSDSQIQRKGIDMTLNAFQEITSPIRALNPPGFPNTMRSDRLDSLVQQQL